MRNRTIGGVELGAGGDFLRRDFARFRFFIYRRKELRGLPVVGRNDAAELALAADLAHCLRPEVGIEHIVPDFASLMRTLGIVEALNTVPPKTPHRL